MEDSKFGCPGLGIDPSLRPCLCRVVVDVDEVGAAVVAVRSVFRKRLFLPQDQTNKLGCKCRAISSSVSHAVAKEESAYA